MLYEKRLSSFFLNLNHIFEVGQQIETVKLSFKSTNARSLSIIFYRAMKYSPCITISRSRYETRWRKSQEDNISALCLPSSTRMMSNYTVVLVMVSSLGPKVRPHTLADNLFVVVRRYSLLFFSALPTICVILQMTQRECNSGSPGILPRLWGDRSGSFWVYPIPHSVATIYMHGRQHGTLHHQALSSPVTPLPAMIHI